MDEILALHFFRRITNAQKRQILHENGTNLGDLKRHVLKYLKRDETAESSWFEACEKAYRETQICKREGVEIYAATDVNKFPSFLLEIPDPPVVLFGRGKWNNSTVPLSVIGSRKMTTYGERLTKSFIQDLSQYPVNIVSGLALGIDGVAHRSALACGASTQAFLAGGLGYLSPKRHCTLAKTMVDQGGGYFTEQSFFTPSLPQYYPVRNRLIAGASLATLVIEAARKSGAMITANQAFQYHREVYAIPGALFQPMSEGTNALIYDEIARAALDPASFVKSFYPTWAKNDEIIDFDKDLEGQLIRHFPHGRRVHSTYLKSATGLCNSQLFRAIQVLLDLGVIEKTAPLVYQRKSIP